MSFVHLHLHTEYSLLDGAIRIKSLPSAVKAMGMNACAITDHGAMYGIIDFYNACIKEKVKPIIGCEIYVSKRSRLDKDPVFDSNPYHLILLAKDYTGFRNLMKLDSIAFVEGFYSKPRVDREALEAHSEGLIALSACLAGEIPRNIMTGDIEAARETAIYYDRIFGRGNFYLEIQNNGIPEQTAVNAAIIGISNETGIPLVATNDCHYLRRADAKAHDILLCMQTAAKISDPKRMRMSSEEFYVKSPREMSESFKGISGAIENSMLIADRCNVELEFGKIHLPEFNAPEGFSSNKEYLRSLAERGLAERLSVASYADEKEYRERLSYELEIISRMGFVDYYLIVWDFIDHARRKGITVGPGRGSGAGSLAAYCLRITDIDPLRFGLIFERFLNVDRVSMPDFDIDFCYVRRPEVIEYVTEKYGKDHVAQVIAFGTLAARAAVKDVARALDISFAESDRIAKMIPRAVDMTLKRAIEVSSELKTEYETNPQTREILDTAMLFEGMPKNPTTHAAGVIISGLPITDIAPLSRNEDNIVVQYSKGNIELVGLLKFDFLGLRTLTVMKDTTDIVKRRYGTDIDFDRMTMDDPEIFRMISEGNTEGIFQLESSGMTNFMKELKPESIEDIIAGISLFRPGPMDGIPRYVAAKHDRSKISFAHKLLEPILDVTYGCIVYQEQVMRIVRDLAGFSLGQSDIVRRAMSKKKTSELAKYRSMFVNGGIDEKGGVVEGAVRKGVPADIAEAVFDDVLKFGGYAFNKSHAAAYAVIAYNTAWLKYYYPVEFMASMMNSFMGDLEQAARYINACRKMGIEILPPDINRSCDRFMPEEGKIRFALSAVKNVGNGMICEVIKERESKGDFISFRDFIERMIDRDVNKKMIESLVKASAFDSFGENRSTLIALIEPFINSLSSEHKVRMEGQLSFFELNTEEMASTAESTVDIKLPEFSERELLAGRVTCDSLAFSPSTPEEEDPGVIGQRICDGQRVVVAGICVSRRTRPTRNNELMANIVIEDLNGQFGCVVFPKTFAEYSPIIREGNALIISGRAKAKDDEMPELTAMAFALLDSSVSEIPGFPVLKRTNVLANGSYLPGGGSGSVEDYFCENLIPPVQEQLPPVQEQFPVSKRIVISYSGLPGDPGYKRLLAALEYFSGDMPVMIEFADNSSRMLEKEFWITFDDATMAILMKRYGFSSVRLI